ncbi:hypothetical protein [Brevundimonas sp.]|uniref:hypothetical protein n=1 Tax=Brevundimonas sp. TaxID=1871086 RepID=UPI002731EACB|nr:hypothetical protein [Brevundimonas sp.]MDP1913754.1 hypothetical protein [Brevundimonas sp.]
MFGVWRTRDGDRLHGDGAFQFERLYVRVAPWRVILIASAVGAYLLGLLLYLPAEAAVGKTREAVGTVWKGETALEPGFALGWVVHPLRSIGSLAPAGAVTVRGPDTAITGDALWRSNALVLRQAAGAGSLRLISALAPGLPFACDGEMTLTATDLAIGGGRTGGGRLGTGPATCAGAGLVTTPPAMSGDLTSDVEGTSLTLKGPDNGELARARLGRDKVVSLTITPAGAAVLPGLTATTLEIR